ncbi:hypothetical protein V6Z98_008829 [Aspergillus fumigatus]
MSKESTDPNAIELLSRLATLLEEVANNLHHNRLDRTAVQTLLHQYSSRAKSDGHLINASKQDSQCVEHGVFLSYVHVELLSWLTKHNYTVPASSVKWYSWRKLSSRKYRLPSLFSSRAHAAQLEDLLRNVVAKAELLQAELRAHELEIPDVAVDYERVSPQAPQGTPPEGMYLFLAVWVLWSVLMLQLCINCCIARCWRRCCFGREGYHDYRWDGVGLSMFCLRLGLVIVLTAFVWIRMHSPPQIMI